MALKSAISTTILLVITTSVLCERWARQLPNEGFGSNANDWIPVPCPTCKPSDRQHGGRVLNFAQTAQASNQQQYIQNVIPQQKHWQHAKLAFNEEPMRLVSQGFLVPPQPNQQQFGFVNQFPQFAYQQENQQQYFQRVPIPQVNNLQYEFVQQPQIGQQNIPQPLSEALIMQKPQVFDKNELQTHVNHLPHQPQQPEEVQLLYVPLDTLYQQKQQQVNEANRNNLIPTNVNPHQINNFYTANPIATSTPASSSISSYHSTESPSFYERTKVKSNQPPLAMFMKNKVKNSHISINDVLGALKNAKNIDVLDSASKKSPKVFVGPSGLKTPEGYTKFELPYLSNIEQDRPNRQINNLPFFVAPLSYHAPNGFAKIPLPSPHVGSVVVNNPDNAVDSAINSETGFSQRHPSFYQPTDFQTQQFYEQNYNFFNPTTSSFLTPTTTSTTTTTTTTTTPRPTTAAPTYRSTTQRPTTPRPVQRHTTRKPNLGFRFGSNVFPSTSEQYQSAYEPTENPVQSFTNEYYQPPAPTTTERNFEYFNRDQDFYNRPSIASTTQSPFNYFNNNNNNNFGSNIAQVSSTVEPTFENNKRGQPIDGSKTKEYEFPKYSHLDAYKTFKPMPTSHVTNEEYFNIDNKDSAKTFPANHRPEEYNENTSQAPFAPLNDFSNFRNKYTIEEKPTVSKENKVEEVYQSQTEKPVEYSTKAQEILKMKSHFREQNSQHIRPNIPSSEGISKETFSYSPVTISFENLLKPLSSTANYDFFDIPKSTDISTEAKPAKISFFTPTPNYDEVRSEKPKEEEQVKYFKYSIIDQTNSAPESQPSSKGIDEVTVEPVSVSNPSVGNKYWESNYNQFNGVSTLRPVQTLPGLINGLMDETSEKALSSTTETVNIPRRSQTRRRRPDTTQPPSTSTTDNSARRTTFRGRRPIHYANRTTTPRTIARNTSRVRYNPTPEERQQLRLQNTNTKKESENLEYQRDVLKQNYPVINRNPSTEAPTIENLSSSYRVAPEAPKTASENEFVVGNERGDVYIKEEDTTAVSVTTLRTVSENTNQRPNFRQSVRKTQRFGTTTTLSPTSGSTQAQERLSRDRYTVRPRSRYETTTQQARTTKKRNDLRQRRPTTTRSPVTSTVSGKEDSSNNDSYQQISRFNTDFYQESTPSTTNHRGGNQQKNHHRYSGSNFGLKSEETRWSVKSNQSSFQPIDPEANEEEDFNEENEPMIVTAQSYSEQDMESFNIPVKQSFDFSPLPTVKEGDKSKESPMETLFEELVNEIVTDSKKNEIVPETEDSENLPSNHKNTFTESNDEKKAQRRGVWKRIRVRPVDTFEAAESQNYGQQYINHIPNDDLKEDRFEKIKPFDFESTSTIETITDKVELEPTTPLAEEESHTEVSMASEIEGTSSTTTELESTSTTEAATEAQIEITTTIMPEEQSNIVSTIRSVESKIEDTTRQSYDQTDAQVTDHFTETPYYDDYDTERIFTDTHDENGEDDQEPQSSDIFSEVKQKLTDLFTIDHDYDYQENNLPLKMQQYTTIERNKSLNKISDEDFDRKAIKPQEVVTEATSSFHQNLMNSVIYATSTSTEVSHETEICYRGRCIKTDKKLKT